MGSRPYFSFVRLRTLNAIGIFYLPIETRVTQSRTKDSGPWWETEVPVIKDELVAYLRRHVPALHPDHDDLLSDTLLSLTKHIHRHAPTLPRSWFNQDVPSDEEERAYLHKLANVILKRRIADNFRKRLIHREYPHETLTQDIADPNSLKPERKIILARILEVTRLTLDEMTPEDRDLVALVSQAAAFRTALDDRERQRLHRIRKRLKDEIARRLGADLTDLLRTPH